LHAQIDSAGNHWFCNVCLAGNPSHES
jgi:hypothetical protein